MYKEITESFTNEEFPEEFGNDLFVCDLYSRQGDAYEYTSNFSIKYVQEGSEFYVVGGKNVELHSGFYLIVNEDQHVICETEKIYRDFAISIFLNRNLIDEVYTALKKNIDKSLEKPFEQLSSGGFYEEVFHFKGDPLGEFLKQITLCHQQDSGLDLKDDRTFYLAAEKLLKTHTSHLTAAGNIDREKLSTREEIFRRVNRGKIYIEDCLFEPITIAQVAKKAALSKYHFIRLFSQVFGISPYKYLLKRRIEEARILLLTEDLLVSEVAKMTGFADVSSFSKQFKKITGVPPSKI